VGGTFPSWVWCILPPRPASQPMLCSFSTCKRHFGSIDSFQLCMYDHIINPGHWTEDMREDALEPADLNDRNMIVLDVGGGIRFTTLGIVKHVDAKNQSPHQLVEAKQKEPLKEFKIVESDAKDLPFPTESTDNADRYISAGR